MADVQKISRSQLEAFFKKDHRLVIALEALFEQAADHSAIEAAQFSADSADAKAVQALSALMRIADALEYLALAPAVLPDVPQSFEPPAVASQHEEAFFLPTVDPEQAPYGDMHSSTATTIVVAAANTPYEITSNLSNTHAHLMTFGGAHYLVAERPGVYKVDWSVSMRTSSANDALEAGIMVDGTAQTEGLAHGTTSNANAAIEVSGTAFIRVAGLQQLSLYVENHSAARDITFEHVTFTADLHDRRVA